VQVLSALPGLDVRVVRSSGCALRSCHWLPYGRAFGATHAGPLQQQKRPAGPGRSGCEIQRLRASLLPLAILWPRLRRYARRTAATTKAARRAAPPPACRCTKLSVFQDI